MNRTESLLVVERTAGEPLESAAQLRAILGLSRRLASIHEIGELIGVLARELSQLIPFDDLTVTLQDVARDGAARYAFDTRTGTLALPEPEGDGGDALESFVIERQRPVCAARSDADAPDLGKRLARAGMTSLCALPLSLRERRLFPSSSAGRGPAFFDLERRARRRMVARSFSDSRGGPRHGEPQAPPPRSRTGRRDPRRAPVNACDLVWSL
jgi:hypothetical protein